MSKQQNISHCKDNNVVDYQRSFSQHKQNKTPLTVMDNHIQSRTVIESNNYESYSYHPTP